mmetsp:Transcript_91930/g.145393  ORF Transcript_91930/g.145393 Transcript_91930/m.145393 type:complete len:240 (-) Transcript_91930:28-747(-)
MVFADCLDGLSANRTRITVRLQFLGARKTCALVAQIAMDDHTIRSGIHANHALGLAGTTLSCIVLCPWISGGINFLPLPRKLISLTSPPDRNTLYPTLGDDLSDVVLEPNRSLAFGQNGKNYSSVGLDATSLIAWALEVCCYDITYSKFWYFFRPIPDLICDPRFGYALLDTVVEIEFNLQQGHGQNRANISATTSQSTSSFEVRLHTVANSPLTSSSNPSQWHRLPHTILKLDSDATI